VVKGGGHSYQGTSNAPDSLLIWTKHMHDVTMHTRLWHRAVPGNKLPSFGNQTPFVRGTRCQRL
jgi:hypothetical protein